MPLSVSNSGYTVYKLGKNYYPQTLLKKCKYKIKEKELQSLIEDDLEIFLLINIVKNILSNLS